MTERRLYTPQGFSRRSFLKRSGAAAAGIAAAGMLPAWGSVSAQDAKELRALVPAAPDPTPPGVPNAAYSQATNDAFAAWQAENGAKVAYEDVPWPQLHDKMATNFASGVHVHDVIYMSGWVPEFAEFLVPFVDQLPSGAGRRPAAVELLDRHLGRPEAGRRLHALAADALLQQGHVRGGGLDGAAQGLGRAEGHRQGADQGRQVRLGAQLRRSRPASAASPPTGWSSCSRPAASSTTTSGMPVFNDAAGVDSLQLMIDLMKFDRPRARSPMSASTTPPTCSSPATPR